MHQKNSWFLSAERIITLPIIFAALWQLLACLSAVFISNFSVIIGTSFILSILGTFVVAVYFPFEKLKFKFWYWLSFMLLATIAANEFISVFQVRISDAFWPTAVIGTVNEIVRGHFPVSFLSFPEFWANYHQGFLFLGGMFARVTHIDAAQSVRILTVVSFMYFVLLVQVTTAKFTQPYWAWLSVFFIFLVRSFQLEIPLFEPFHANLGISIPEYFESNSWPLTLCIFMVIILTMPKKLENYTPARFFTHYILFFSLVTTNACLFAVERIVYSLLLPVIFIVYSPYLFRLKWIFAGLISMILLWILPRFIPSAFLVGVNYEPPKVGLHFLGNHPESIMSWPVFALKHIMLGGPIAASALYISLLCLVKRTVPDIRKSPQAIILASTMSVAFLFPLVFSFSNINWWDNLHKFSVIWLVSGMTFISIFIPAILNRTLHLTSVVVTAVFLSLFGVSAIPEASWHWFSILGQRVTRAGDEPYTEKYQPYADVVSFLRSQKKAPLIYPYGTELSAYSPALFIASFSGSFLRNCFYTNFLLSGEVKTKYSNSIDWWRPDLMLSVVEDTYDPAWILLGRDKLHSFEDSLNKFNQSEFSSRKKIYVSEMKYFNKYILARIGTKNVLGMHSEHQ